MNCDYFRLKDAYTALSKEKFTDDSDAVAVIESFMNLGPVRRTSEFLRPNNKIHDSMRKKFEELRTSLPVNSDKIYNFYDNDYNSFRGNPVYIGPYGLSNLVNDTTFYLSTSANKNFHTAGFVGNITNSEKHFKYQLILTDKNNNIRTTTKKVDNGDKLYIKFDNVGTGFLDINSQKIALMYIVVAKPNVQVPMVIDTIDTIPATFQPMKHLVSFS